MRDRRERRVKETFVNRVEEIRRQLAPAQRQNSRGDLPFLRFKVQTPNALRTTRQDGETPFAILGVPIKPQEKIARKFRRARRSAIRAGNRRFVRNGRSHGSRGRRESFARVDRFRDAQPRVLSSLDDRRYLNRRIPKLRQIATRDDAVDPRVAVAQLDALSRRPDETLERHVPPLIAKNDAIPALRRTPAPLDAVP